MDESHTRIETLWPKICATLRNSGTLTGRSLAELPQIYLLSVSYERVLLAVGSTKLADRVRTTLHDPLQVAFSRELGHDAQLVVTVDESLTAAAPSVTGGTSEPTPDAQTVIDLTVEEPARATQPAHTAGGAATPKPGQPAHPAEPSPRRRDRAGGTHDATNLNHRYTFETFVTGSSNRLASSAAKAVAEGQGNVYNPLFIYGSSGLGKTHLLHAIGWYALTMDPSLKVRYVNSEEFTNEFINAIQRGGAQQFQQRYRDVDFLLIDDIQFLSNKEETQEAFFHTFNALHQNNKQVVITSDLPPKQLTGFEERMKSRFEWGLLCDVHPPSLETRIAILRTKAAADNVAVDADVLVFIAERVSNNIRNLEGALTRVTAANSLAGKPVTLSQIEHSLRDIIGDTDSTEITVPLIMGQVSDYYKVAVDEIVGTSRSRKIVDARQVAMYISRELTDLSLPKIGAEFGGRDHSTVVHAVKRISERISKEQALFDEINELTSRIKGAYSS